MSIKTLSRSMVLFFLLSFVFTAFFSIGSFAATPFPDTLTSMGPVVCDVPPDDILGQNQELPPGAVDGINKIGGIILRYAKVAGMIIAVVILAVYGIQWFIASPQQKAILKEKMWAYVIGAAFVFAAATLLGWLADAVVTVLK